MDLEIQDWGRLDYNEALQRQLAWVQDRINDSAPDRLILVEHPPVITLGRSGSRKDLCVSKCVLQKKGIDLHLVDRGGQATFHTPGQLVAYPIIKLLEKDLHAYLGRLLEVGAAVVRSYSLEPVLKKNRPGIWIESGKIASVGIAVKKWVTYHGLALNVSNDLEGFKSIVPCGHPEEEMASLQGRLGYPVDLQEVKDRFLEAFQTHFGYRTIANRKLSSGKHPHWLVRPAPDLTGIDRMEALLENLHLATVCQSAQCPNLGECFNRGTATFMILGTQCTRTCRFCAVDSGKPRPVDPGEPERVARAAQLLDLKHLVVTSVTRDDLPDGGAGQFTRTIDRIRRSCRQATVEVLIPDFKGSVDALQNVCTAGPDILNHNVETVNRLYPEVRPGASYRRSLGILEYAANQRVPVKSGLMLGLGETEDEIGNTLRDLKRTGCRFLTLGQYLAPSENHHPVDRFVTPGEFDKWAERGHRLGFASVTAGPLVRSSYRAEEMVPPTTC